MHTPDHRTYRIKAPVSTHFRQASCAEVDCAPYLHGWRLRWDVLSESDRRLATHSGRKWRLDSVSEHENWLVFESGQACFASGTHRTRVERAEIFVVKDGLSAPRIHDRPEDWAEDLHEHTDRVSAIRQRG